MDFSKDAKMVAVGTTDSYIRVWSLDGKPLRSRLPAEKDLKVNNRRLVGHSAPVYSVAFSDAIANLDRNIYEGEPQPETDAKMLLSCSADGQVRLWSLEVWSCLCIYKGHDGPVMSLSWGPHGHYFATGGWDKTVRIWSQDHASAQRLLIGHDTAISALTWHPNGTYVFSASDEADKSIRMWSVSNGDCVRIFTGHVDYISALEVTSSSGISLRVHGSSAVGAMDVVASGRSALVSKVTSLYPAVKTIQYVSGMSSSRPRVAVVSHLNRMVPMALSWRQAAAGRPAITSSQVIQMPSLAVPVPALAVAERRGAKRRAKRS